MIEFLHIVDTACVELWEVCDGKIHCLDHTDELNCKEWDCSPGFWKCSRDGSQCIKADRVCDGIIGDCIDLSDEQDCQDWICADGMWHCQDGKKCIPDVKRCDGQVDCQDVSDELVIIGHEKQGCGTVSDKVPISLIVLKW